MFRDSNVKFRLNTTKSPATGVSPIELILGFRPTLPEDFAWSISPQNSKINKTQNSDYLQWLNQCKKIILNDALNHQKLYDEQRKRYFDSRITTVPQFHVGDLVRFKKWTATKLEPQFSIPYRISHFKYDSDTVVTIMNPDTGHSLVINTSNLIPAFPQKEGNVSKKNINKRIKIHHKKSVPKLESINNNNNINNTNKHNKNKRYQYKYVPSISANKNIINNNANNVNNKIVSNKHYQRKRLVPHNSNTKTIDMNKSSNNNNILSIEFK